MNTYTCPFTLNDLGAGPKGPMKFAITSPLGAILSVRCWRIGELRRIIAKAEQAQRGGRAEVELSIEEMRMVSAVCDQQRADDADVSERLAESAKKFRMNPPGMPKRFPTKGH